MNLIFSVLGIAGGLICAIADLLFDLKGRHNQKLGSSKNIDSRWLHMRHWRFGASIVLAFIGCGCIGLGIYSLGIQIMEKSYVLGLITLLCGYFGIIADYFTHALLCFQALVYKGIMKRGNLQIADDALENVYSQVTLLTYFGYLILLVPCVTVIIAIFCGYLSVSLWCVWLNPIVFMLIGAGFRYIDKDLFQDLPGIVMSSLGWAAFCSIGLLTILGG